MLTPVEYALLKILSSQAGRVFSRDQLMNGMYTDYRVVSDRAVDTHVKNLRKKLSRSLRVRRHYQVHLWIGLSFRGLISYG